MKYKWKQMSTLSYEILLCISLEVVDKLIWIILISITVSQNIGLQHLSLFPLKKSLYADLFCVNSDVYDFKSSNERQ